MHLAELQSDEYFKQAYVEGKREYAAHLIMHSNKLVFSKTMQSTFSEIYFAKGDNFRGYSHKVVDHSHLGKLFEKILNKLGYQGICCIDYKIENCRVRIFEIN